MKKQTRILSLRLINNEIDISNFEEGIYRLNEDHQLFEDLVNLNFRLKYISHVIRKIAYSQLKAVEIENGPKNNGHLRPSEATGVDRNYNIHQLTGINYAGIH